MQKSIRQDLSIRIGFVILFISISIGIVSYFFSIQYHKKEFAQTIEKQTKYFSDTFTLQLWLFDLNTTRELCKLISESTDVSGLRLFNHKKEIVFEQKPLYKNGTVFVNKELRYKGKKTVGYLEIFFIDTSWKEHRQSIFLIVIAIIIGTMVGAYLVINSLLSNYLSKPLKNLQKNMTLLEQGNFRQSGLVKQRSEIQTIVDTFNKLAASLQEKDDEVTRKTDALKIEILERKHTEKALLESEKSLKSIYKAAENVAFVVTDCSGKDTKILDLSPGAEKIFGYSRKEAIGQKVSIFHPPEFVKGFSKIQTEYLENKKKYSDEVVMVRKSGERFSALYTVFPKFNDRGILIGTIGVAIDITERKREEERYKTTIESSIDGFWMVDTKGCFREVNEAYCNMIGYSRDELLNMSIMDIELVEQPEETKKRIEKIIKTGSDKFESRHRHKKGNIIEVEVSATYSQDSKGMSFVFLRDITERKQFESHLQQAQKMESIGTLAGGIAHDFNNILFPIVGHTEMLLEDVPEDSPFREGLNQIYTGALRASELVKQILTFSRQGTDELKLMKIQHIIKEASKLIRSTIPTTIEIKQNINPNCGTIKADPTQIHQIVMNLCTNAYHAMEETGGELKIDLKEVELNVSDLFNPNMKPGVYACLTIADTGLGIDKNLIKNIFDPFFTTKAKGKGTGMGLSVVHGIVIGMNGAIQVYSESGKGTEFHVYLPVEKSFAEGYVPSSKSEIQGGTEQILLVDDEKAILTMEKQMLERLGYQVTSRTSSIEALEVFRDSPDKFDLVITDMAMPNMPGDKLAVELTKIRPDIPVLLCTGFSETMSEEKAASIGIKGFLLKPIIMKDLSHKIREVLDEN